MQLHCGSYNPNWSDFCFGNRVSEVVYILPIILTSKPSTLLGRDFKTNVYRSGSKCDPCMTYETKLDYIYTSKIHQFNTRRMVNWSHKAWYNLNHYLQLKYFVFTLSVLVEENSKCSSLNTP